MSKVLVDRKALEEAAEWLEMHSSSSGSAEWFAAGELRDILAQPSEAEGDRIASGFVILDGMAFSKDEIMAQRVDLCNALESLSAVTAERDQLRAEVEALRKDAARLDRLDIECEAYGCEGIHEGNRWIIDGPFRTVRDAIDAAMAAKEA